MSEILFENIEPRTSSNVTVDSDLLQFKQNLLINEWELVEITPMEVISAAKAVNKSNLDTDVINRFFSEIARNLRIFGNMP